MMQRPWDFNQALNFIEKGMWTFAKSMPEVPHQYVLRKHYPTPDRLRDFQNFAMYIWVNGYKCRWSRMEPKPYLRVGEWVYWTMRSDYKVITVINREKFSTSSIALEYEKQHNKSEEANQCLAYQSP
jgi:hypothetical protein